LEALFTRKSDGNREEPIFCGGIVGRFGHGLCKMVRQGVVEGDRVGFERFKWLKQTEPELLA
jgi:hypothetical protein